MAYQVRRKTVQQGMPRGLCEDLVCRRSVWQVLRDGFPNRVYQANTHLAFHKVLDTQTGMPVLDSGAVSNNVKLLKVTSSSCTCLRASLKYS